MWTSLALALALCCISLADGGTFSIDHNKGTFLLDGKPFHYVSGSLHYSRVHPNYWEDRLKKMKAAGLNVVQTYVPWNIHEPAPGQFNFTGFSDLERFLTLAKQEELYVLLRAGPYVCGEWEFGGFPAWLLTINPNMIFRTMDPDYITYVDKWFNKLLPMMRPYLYINGGPILMVQVENEYGSYYACDKNYTAHLRDLFWSLLGKNVTLYTTDGNSDGFLQCGYIDGVYATVDFGVNMDPSSSFAAQRDYEPNGPAVNSEFYSGWLDHWGEVHQKVNSTTFALSLDLMLNYGANINIWSLFGLLYFERYMFEGGTNFAYWNGANFPPYDPVPTSYDYDAPLNESGDTTDKFFYIRQSISKFYPVPEKVPPNLPKNAYGNVTMKFVSTVQDALKVLCPEGPHMTTYPVSMEAISHYYGFILYRTKLPKDYPKGATLSMPGLRDRGYITLNQMPVGVFSRNGATSGTMSGKAGDVLDILVENQGRINYGTAINYNLKGLIMNVTLNDDTLTNWAMYPIHLENVNSSTISFLLQQQIRSAPLFQGNFSTPSLYMGTVSVPGTPADTFLDPRPFSKGQALVNSFNLGRYWPSAGPQVRLYVPAPVLFSGTSQLVLLELESSPCQTPGDKCMVYLSNQSYIDGPPLGHQIKWQGHH